jgi:CubicO group peptidase (beta-lactamase class C family)
MAAEITRRGDCSWAQDNPSYLRKPYTLEVPTLNPSNSGDGCPLWVVGTTAHATSAALLIVLQKSKVARPRIFRENSSEESNPAMAIDKILTKPIDAGLIPGIVALAADDRGVVYRGAFGRRAVDKTEPMTLDSVFRIASMTKAVTTTAAMQLIEQQRIGLEQPMGDVLPAVKDVKVLEGFSADGMARLRDPKSPVTLRHLLTHTSGYGYDIFNPDLARYLEVAGLPSILSHKNEALRVPLLFDPGTNWEYGIGLDLVGKVVEAVSGEDLESYFRQHILDPLGMHDTSFLLRNDMAQRLVGTHVRGPDGKPVAITFEVEEGEFRSGGAGTVLHRARLPRFHPDAAGGRYARWREGAQGGDGQADGA